MVEVQIGECAVVTNFVGEEGTDTLDINVNAKIVENGLKGIWNRPTRSRQARYQLRNLQSGYRTYHTDIAKLGK